jgi:hypothetical protein
MQVYKTLRGPPEEYRTGIHPTELCTGTLSSVGARAHLYQQRNIFTYCRDQLSHSASCILATSSAARDPKPLPKLNQPPLQV